MHAEPPVYLASTLPTYHVYIQKPWALQLTPAKALTCPLYGPPESLPREPFTVNPAFSS